MIGKITPAGKDGAREVVKRGDEAVIGCHIRPISSLVRNPYLQKAINESVRIYTQETISGKSTCNSMQCSLCEIIAYGNSTWLGARARTNNAHALFCASSPCM